MEHRAREETWPTGYLLGTATVGSASHCVSAWEGGGGRIPAARAPGLLGASRILSASPLALFSVWVECLFLGLGDRHGGREPASSGRSEREGERKRSLEV